MKQQSFLSTILVTMLCLNMVGQQAQAQEPSSLQSKTNSARGVVSNSSTLLARVWRGRRPGFSLVPSSRASVTGLSSAVASPAVHGSGTVGKISLWVDTSPSGESTLGDSIITQLNGNIGIGAATPTSKLTVQGMIETTLGGYKFPDGTVQTTAAVTGLQTVSHDSTLTGDGTAGSPLGVAVPLVLSGSVEFTPLVSVINNNVGFGSGLQGSMANGYGVRGISSTLNGVAGLSASSDGVLGQSSSTGFITGGVKGFCSSCNGVVGQSTDGRGVLGTGPTGVYGQGDNSNSSSSGGHGMKGLGGGSQFGSGGTGVEAIGGFSPIQGGKGLVVTGGDSVRPNGGNNTGGSGIVTSGGNATSTNLEGDTIGGDGLVATGGNTSGTLFGGDFPGSGVNATGGKSSLGIGGVGVFATGGISRDAGGFVHGGGVGIVATGGSGNPPGRAALFRGDVDINGSLDISGPAGGGNLTVSGTKNFKIDHPLDPENKYLLHAAIESSEALNVYSGNIVTDAKGEAVVTLPEWFEALNRDLRYQLTVIGVFAQAIVAGKVKQNRFTIRTSTPSVEVSWQVTGVRSDAVMRNHPFKAEEHKPERERGSYLSPELFGKPEARGVEWARNPEVMQQLKQQRK